MGSDDLLFAQITESQVDRVCPGGLQFFLCELREAF